MTSRAQRTMDKTNATKAPRGRETVAKATRVRGTTLRLSRKGLPVSYAGRES